MNTEILAAIDDDLYCTTLWDTFHDELETSARDINILAVEFSDLEEGPLRDGMNMAMMALTGYTLSTLLSLANDRVTGETGDE